jgi:hypothetical protein
MPPRMRPRGHSVTPTTMRTWVDRGSLLDDGAPSVDRGGPETYRHLVLARRGGSVADVGFTKYPEARARSVGTNRDSRCGRRTGGVGVRRGAGHLDGRRYDLAASTYGIDHDARADRGGRRFDRARECTRTGTALRVATPHDRGALATRRLGVPGPTSATPSRVRILSSALATG